MAWSRYVTLLIPFNFSKAFNSISQVVLLQKPRQADLAVTSIKRMTTYQTGRERAMLDTRPFIVWSVHS